jgi:hypothetical protein
VWYRWKVEHAVNRAERSQISLLPTGPRPFPDFPWFRAVYDRSPVSPRSARSTAVPGFPPVPRGLWPFPGFPPCRAVYGRSRFPPVPRGLWPFPDQLLIFKVFKVLMGSLRIATTHTPCLLFALVDDFECGRCGKIMTKSFEELLINMFQCYTHSRKPLLSINAASLGDFLPIERSAR